MENNTTINQPNVSNMPPLSPIQPPKAWKPSFVILIVAIIAVAGVAYGSIQYLMINKTAPTVVPSNSSSPTPNETIQWKGDGAPMSDQKLVIKYQDDFNPTSMYKLPDPIRYYDMGINGSNKVILAVAPAIDPSGPAIFFFEETQGGYRFMSKASNTTIYNSDNKQGYVLSSKIIATDSTTIYNDITGPTSFDYRGLKLKQEYLAPSDLFKNYVSDQNELGSTSIKKVDTVSFGDLYLRQLDSYSQDNKTVQFYIRRYILKLHSGLYTAYDAQYDFFSDNSVPNITWSDNTKNKDTYRKDASLGGCGNPGAYAVVSHDVADAIKPTGTTNTGQTIYEFKDMNDPVIKFFYDLGGRVYNTTTGISEPISINVWYTYHPVILYNNAIGDFVIFTNDKYGIQAECGKPVIYLYPTQSTGVRVQVGADISKSEPAYNNGWLVQANPDGVISNSDGRIYDSLFWEGIGHGSYPAIKEGFVMPTIKAEITLRSQLKELGLSEKESADFLEFWLPKMPNTPYVRLTWFTTRQLDELAPLIVWPKPDTNIRVFLDFQGLQESIQLPAQHLTTISRQGFTLVEWGGILRK